MTYDHWKTTDPTDADYMPEPDEPTEFDLVYEQNHQLRIEIERLRKLLDETVRERETYNSYHQTAAMEIERLRALVPPADHSTVEK